MGQERLGPSYFFIPLVLGPLNSLVWYVPSLRYTRGLGWRMHCGVEVTESSTNKQHHVAVSDTVVEMNTCKGKVRFSPLISVQSHMLLLFASRCILPWFRLNLERLICCECYSEPA